MAARLTELEGAVLGCIWTDGPLTTYALRTRFAKSRSSHFSGSAGAIYPLVERLKKGGLVSATSRKQGERKSRLCTITGAGKKAFRQWLNPPIPNWMAAVEFDPIRARVHFLAMLPYRQQQRFIQEAVGVLEAEIEATKTLIAELSESGEKWKTWGARGALGVLQARLAWLCDIRTSE